MDTLNNKPPAAVVADPLPCVKVEEKRTNTHSCSETRI